MISLPLADLIDLDAERARLNKQLKELGGWIAGTRNRLGNAKFVESAPPRVVADARAKLAELEAREARTRELLDTLK